MKPLYFLTPTGGRPKAITMLFEHMESQNYAGEATWIIVDDCEPATPLPESRFDVRQVRPKWRWSDGENTQARSLAAGLEFVPDNANLLIIEDDDVYLPRHVETVMLGMIKAELVGQMKMPYYNVQTGRFRVMQSAGHCALCTTGMRDGAIHTFRQLVETELSGIDTKLWRRFIGPKAVTRACSVVGVKGMPGRGGIGVGHRKNFGELDINGAFMSIVGEKIAKSYARFAQ